MYFFSLYMTSLFLVINLTYISITSSCLPTYCRSIYRLEYGWYHVTPPLFGAISRRSSRRYLETLNMSLKYIDNARKILCIGRNYAAHIKELNNVAPQQPFFFLKPSSSILKPKSGPFLVPRGVVVLHEVELAFVLNLDLKALPTNFSAEEPL